MQSQSLKEGSLLQGGKYKIDSTLGQGGFGITYLATQVLLDRKVAVKEFFMKEYCNRDADTSFVSVPSEGSRDLVDRFRAKFIREARMIASLSNPHIVKIHDVFEENGTAYYVMEYMPGGSLKEKAGEAGLPASQACSYSRQISSALEYLHNQNILHLDVKPSNILFDKAGNAVLIDFGISKHYDESGGQTSSTPVGISKGYAPLEQYQQGDIASFTPATDIYSLGATLYSLMLGAVPPEASVVYEDGLPELDASIPANIRMAIQAAMQPKRKDRPQSIKQFLDILNAEVKDVEPADDDETEVPVAQQPEGKRPLRPTPQPKPAPKPKAWWPYVSALMGAVACVAIAFFWVNREEPAESAEKVEHYAVKSAEGKLLYYWTGDMNEGQPEGEGVIEYDKDDKDGRKEYKGTVTKGMRNDDSAVLTYSNGNSYNGSFTNDNLNEGRLVLKSDGMYFEGTFKDNQPYNGKWYFTDGTYYSAVTNGEEK